MTVTRYAVRYRGCYRGDGNPDPSDKDVGKVLWWTMAQILDEVNRDRSSGWTDYDETDWTEGLDEWTWYEPVLGDDGKPTKRRDAE